MIVIDITLICKIIKLILFKIYFISYFVNFFIYFKFTGVLSLCALDFLNITNKNIVCIISGGNSDVFRMNEIMERSLLYQGLKHYFKIELKQKVGALKEYILNILGDNNIIYFKYTRIINKETGPIILGIETNTKEDIIDIMDLYNITYKKLNYNDISI